MWQPALVISIAALLFTVFSFWWMNWRPGKLSVGRPRSYAAIGSASGKVLVEVPLVFFNRGASPVLVQNLRLHIEGGGTPLRFNALVDRIGTDEGRRFATQFPVRQQEAVTLICEFQRGGGGLLFEARPYSVTLEGVWGRSLRWRRLAMFDLNVTEADLPSINGRLIVRDNWRDNG
jgi:hypothetical protein